ncbi:MAG TPA: 2,4'-dihydroxyacetophenone dioxygenase family protein [Burkholderiaceae bacterium]|jgi:2,4'-dihydroxyacetophenone dioxygenase|nr:2,4'-dihydroxyacetophenone dioxygenase family protein [Burkholderiaceae bacterium]
MSQVLPFPRELQPQGIREEIVTPVLEGDDRLWVPIHDNVWFKPLLLNITHGYWTSVLRVRRKGVVSCHRHPATVHGYVIKGSWRYLEHDWTAREGSYVFEPPGETHTLVSEEEDEMLTWFLVNGALIYVDENGKQTGYTDVFDRVEKCREHYRGVAAAEKYLDSIIR